MVNGQGHKYIAVGCCKGREKKYFIQKSSIDGWNNVLIEWKLTDFFIGVGLRL